MSGASSSGGVDTNSQAFRDAVAAAVAANAAAAEAAAAAKKGRHIKVEDLTEEEINEVAATSKLGENATFADMVYLAKYLRVTPTENVNRKTGKCTPNKHDLYMKIVTKLQEVRAILMDQEASRESDKVLVVVNTHLNNQVVQYNVMAQGSKISDVIAKTRLQVEP